MSDRKILFVFIGIGLVMLAAVVGVTAVYLRDYLPFDVEIRNGTVTVYIVTPYSD